MTSILGEGSGDTLIIKLGSLGDVLRTTPLLRRLKGRITWVTRKEAFPLLVNNPAVNYLLSIEQAPKLLKKKFNLVVNFDEDDRACRLASEASALKKVGVHYSGKGKVYCEGSAPWFDMSLVSRLGLQEANRLKARCRCSYQHFIFNACGLKFKGEEYMLPPHPTLPPHRGEVGGGSRRTVALEPRVGPRWPAKAWKGYSELARILRREGFQVHILKQRRRLTDYFEDINHCGILVSGDTLALHAGLALRKRVIGLFNCTSPWEIFGYGRMVKIVNPFLHRHFYQRSSAPELAGGIPVDCVAQAVSHP